MNCKLWRELDSFPQQVLRWGLRLAVVTALLALAAVGWLPRWNNPLMALAVYRGGVESATATAATAAISALLCDILLKAKKRER